MTLFRSLPLVSALALTTFSSAASLTKTILPDNVIRCEPDSGCTSQTMDGRNYKVLATPRFTVMVAVSHEGSYTRADINVFNKTDMPLNLSPEDFRVEVVTPKPKVLLYVSPSDLKDLPAAPATPPTSSIASSPLPSQAPVIADTSQTPNIDELYKEAKQKAALKEETDKIASQRDLSATSLPPNEVASGRVFFERDKHAQLVNVVLPIAGLVFEFPYIMK